MTHHHHHTHDDGHSHAHDHDHGHGHGHAHGHAHLHDLAKGNRRALAGALVVTCSLLIAELVGGLVFHSLALLGDAAHMLTDVVAYAIALMASRLAMRAPTSTRTFGLQRAEVLAALINAAALIGAMGWLAVESFRRLFNPLPVQGAGVMIIALFGLLANLLAMFLLLRADRDHLNIRGAILHTLGDALSSVGVLVGAAIVMTTGWEQADSIAALLVCALVVHGAWRLARDSVDMLLDRAPVGANAESVAEVALAQDGVTEIHDIHIWNPGPGMTSLSAHVRHDGRRDPDRLLHHIRQQLEDELGITHVTIQMTRDLSSPPIAATDRLPLADAIDWATDELARAFPGTSRSVILAAAGAAALSFPSDEPVSPIAVSVRTRELLDGGEQTQA